MNLFYPMFFGGLIAEISFFFGNHILNLSGSLYQLFGIIYWFYTVFVCGALVGRGFWTGVVIWLVLQVCMFLVFYFIILSFFPDLNDDVSWILRGDVYENLPLQVYMIIFILRISFHVFIPTLLHK